MAHAHCMLDTLGYKRTLTLRNNSCFPTTTVVTRTRLIVTLPCHISDTATAGQNTEMRGAVTPREQFSASLRIPAAGRNYADLKFSVADSCWHCVLSYQHKNPYVTEIGLDSLPAYKVIMTSHT